MTDAVNVSLDPESVQPKETFSRQDYRVWLDAILSVARHYRLDCSAENVRIASLRANDSSVEDVLRQMARQAGLTIKFATYDPTTLTQWRTPLVVQMQDGQVGVIQTLGEEDEVGIAYSGDQGLQSSISRQQLLENALRTVILRPARPISDVRTNDYIKPYDEHWFRKIVLRDLRPYGHVMLASLVANILGLGGVLFSMQVYDRVIPAESLPTLYVLFGGVLLAIFFDFIMRLMRMKITDLLGKRADLRVSDLVFGHALRLRNSARPKSTGSFISQLRELESLRDLITSSTATALADLPFFLIFLVVFYLIGGPLVLIPLFALVAMVVPGLMAQRKLARLANKSMRESALRNAMLVETVQGMDDIKSLQAEQRFQQQWNHYNAVAADSSLRLRTLTNGLVAWTQNVQSAVFAIVIVFGAPMVIAGDLTTGSLVAASILASRMMAPVSQLTHVLTRWQQAKVALEGLNRLMKMPVDHPEGAQRVHLPVITGRYELKRAGFKYSEEARTPALTVNDLTIEPGERIAVLGRNGAGKSTFLQALAGSLDLSSGSISLDGVALGHIDPADVRRDVGLLTQNSRLFHGSLRENLIMGAGQASDQEIIEALGITGALDFVRSCPTGMDHLILEGGLGLSGGQRQSLLLSRLLIRQPHILLLDEPTASLDEVTERKLIQNLAAWGQGRTLIIATHRTSVLSMVDRIIVVDNGQVVIDDTKDNAIAKLSRPKGQAQ
ncbi:type I secretion system permease/ATPase [Pseudomonas sp. UBA4194]|uniref:type I secretion system permease/ATPase n=1 Tax=Pseudomonas sp. UBA4194 TaxID=1947317 RepID=UPI0025D38793|nr:type I secretion system permease/ATPase [Pseudomonas sp. UBA4194]